MGKDLKTTLTNSNTSYIGIVGGHNNLLASNTTDVTVNGGEWGSLRLGYNSTRLIAENLTHKLTVNGGVFHSYVALASRGTTSGKIDATFNGGTHMPFEDVALYRTIPGAAIVDVTDIPMLVDTLKKAKDLPGVKYIRVPRKDSCQIYADGSNFTVGKGNVLREGKDAVIIACGIMVHEALQAAKQLAEQGIDAMVIDPYTIKPLDRELILTAAEKTGVVVVAENHNRIGGLTSAVSEVLAENGVAVAMEKIGIHDEFGEVGDMTYLMDRFQLTAPYIAEAVRKAVAKKA
jgi:transketolase